MKLVDTIAFRAELVNESTSSGRRRYRGTFQRCDEENANKRIYPRKLWERILTSPNIRERISKRRMVGEVDHPSTAEMELKRAAVVITELDLNKNGGNEVIGEFEILPTAYGNHLSALIEAGVEIGISSRGDGTIYTKEGKQYISEDYQLETFDIVASPSTRGAFPLPVNESIKSKEEELNTMDKFTKLSERARLVESFNVEGSTTAQRQSILTEGNSILSDLGKAVAEDPTIQFSAKALSESLSDSMRSIRNSKSPSLEDRYAASEKLISALLEEKAKLVLEVKRSRSAVQTLNESAKKKPIEGGVNEIQKLKETINTLKRQLYNQGRRLEASEAIGKNAFELLERLKKKTPGRSARKRTTESVQPVRRSGRFRRLDENGTGRERTPALSPSNFRLTEVDRTGDSAVSPVEKTPFYESLQRSGGFRY